MKIKERINDWIEANKEDFFELLQKMVQSASTQGNEFDVQKIVANFLSELNVEIDQWDLNEKRLQNHPYFYSNRKKFTDSPNVVGVLKGKGDGKSLILNGHVDVVPEGNHKQWKNDPFSGKIENGRMYGRGTTDMKGGNIALLMALAAIVKLDIRLKGDVIFQSVVEEESGGSGTLDAILKGYTADAAIIPEPTNMKIFPKQQGSKWFRITITGRTAHGGTRYHGVNAIEKAFIVYEHLIELETIRNARITDPLYDTVPIPIPINVGTISGGEWPSSVPDVVKLEGRIGIAPNEKIEQVQKEMEDWLLELANKDQWFSANPVKIEWFGARWIPGEIDNEHPLLHALTKNYVAIMNEQPLIEAAPWGTDGGLLAQVGETPTVVFGPGITELAHFPNEAIELDKIVATAKIIAHTIIDWCEVD